MNQHDPRRGDSPHGDGDVSTERLNDSEAVVGEAVFGEPAVQDARGGEHDDEIVEDDEYVVEPARSNTVQVNRPLFLAVVTFGALAILGLGILSGWLWMERGDEDPVIATVNGEKIHRSEYDKAVAQQNGEEVLDGLVLERLVSSEARKRNVTVSQDETDKLLNEQKQQFGNEQAFQAALAQAGLSEDDLVKRLRLSEMLRRMVADKIEVSDQEISATFANTADRYPGQTVEQAREQIKSDIQQQKQQNAVRDLLDQVRAEATIETHLPGKPANPS